MPVPVRTCTVTFTDDRGSRHSVDIFADSLFEAAVLGIKLLRENGGWRMLDLRLGASFFPSSAQAIRVADYLRATVL